MAPTPLRRPSTRQTARPALAAALDPWAAAFFAAWMLLLSAAAARAEDGAAGTAGGETAAEDAGLSVGGEVSLSHAFMPAVAKGEDLGRYNAGSLAVSVSSPVGCSVSASQTVIQVFKPEREITQADPIGSVSCSLTDAGGNGNRISVSASASPGWSEASREAFYYGNVRPSMSLSHRIDKVTVGIGVAYTRHFHRYTMAASGAANTKQSRSVSFFTQSGLGKGFTAGLNLAYVMREPYEGLGDPRYGYTNGASIGWSATEALSFDVGLSTTDSQLAPDGSERNEYALYQRSKTELSISAAYAL